MAAAGWCAMEMSWIAAAIGLVVGMLVGLTGVGGAALTTPALVLVLRVDPAVAVGSDLMYAAITKLVGAWQHARQGSVDRVVVRRLLVGSLPATVIALAALIWLRRRAALDGVVIYLLGGALVLVALLMLLQPQRWRWGALDVPGSGRLGLAVAGAVVAAIVAFTSVGSGSLLLAFLAVRTRLSATELVGTSVAHAVLVTGIDAAAHQWLGSVDWALVINLLCGSIPGVWIGSRAALAIPESWLRRGVALLLLFSGWRLVALD